MSVGTIEYFFEICEYYRPFLSFLAFTSSIIRHRASIVDLPDVPVADVLLIFDLGTII